MTKWLNPEIALAQLRWINDNASTLLLLDTAPLEGSIDPNSIVAEGTIDFDLPIKTLPTEAGGGQSITFSVTPGESYAALWDDEAPTDYMRARRNANITHVAIVRSEYGANHNEQLALYVTTCPPSPVEAGQPLTCEPFDLTFGGLPL